MVLARAAFLVQSAVLLVPLWLAPGVVADDAYDQPTFVWWDTTDLDVLVAGVHDPAIGESIRHAIRAWEAGIAAYAPPWLADNLTLRVFFQAFDPVPPPGFEPDDVEILFVPQGFVAIGSPRNVCIATAPLAHEYAYAGASSLFRVSAHEFGHCLGLGHVFNHGVEYAPHFDLMGGGRAWACPSNLNVLVLERVYGHLFGLPSGGTVTIPSSEYQQIPAC